MSISKVQRVALTALIGLASAFPVAAQAPELAMLANLTPGAWELRTRGTSAVRTICLRTGRELIQLQHRQSGCTSYVIQDDAQDVTVQYTCRGDGYGRTTIRREGNNLVQVSSQGIQGGAPFAISGEARRTGPC
jgi:hypothetical protein